MPESAHSHGRLRDLDRGKGLGIFLVVLGHIVARQPPAHNEWYVLLKDLIYHFHMPFFLFLSGLVAGVTYKPVPDLKAWVRFVGRRFDRLIPAYLLMAAVVFVGKWVAQSTVVVDNPIGSLGEFAEVLYSPRTSYSQYLWYIYVLFLYCLPLPALLEGRNPVRMAVGVALAAAASCYGQYASLPPTFGVDLFCTYAVFFFAGAVAGSYWTDYLELVGKWGAASLMVFLVVLLGDGAGWWNVPRLWVGSLSCVALHWVVRLDPPPASTFLDLLGRYSFQIYLLNTVAIGSVKAVVLKFTSWDGVHFLAVAPLLLASGLFLPIVVREKVLRRIPLVERWTA